MKYFKKQHINPIAIIKIEAHLIKEHYSFIECKSLNGGLYCYGSFQPTQESNLYHYRIKYFVQSNSQYSLENLSKMWLLLKTAIQMIVFNLSVCCFVWFSNLFDSLKRSRRWIKLFNCPLLKMFFYKINIYYLDYGGFGLLFACLSATICALLFLFAYIIIKKNIAPTKIDWKCLN